MNPLYFTTYFTIRYLSSLSRFKDKTCNRKYQGYVEIPKKYTLLQRRFNKYRLQFSLNLSVFEYINIHCIILRIFLLYKFTLKHSLQLQLT